MAQPSWDKLCLQAASFLASLLFCVGPIRIRVELPLQQRLPQSACDGQDTDLCMSTFIAKEEDQVFMWNFIVVLAVVAGVMLASEVTGESKELCFRSLELSLAGDSRGLFTFSSFSFSIISPPPSLSAVSGFAGGGRESTNGQFHFLFLRPDPERHRALLLLLEFERNHRSSAPLEGQPRS